MGSEAKSGNYFLMCERKWIYHTLITVAGFYGAFTYLLRGNVFCNAQTGNVVLMGMALGSGEWGHALYYLIPISAYLMGALISELVPNPIKHHLPLRWDTMLIAIEMAVVIALGFVPESAPVQISQVAINFIASMQYNTFRSMQGQGVSTVFCTNNLRQAVIHYWHYKKSSDKNQIVYMSVYIFVIAVFALGVTAGFFLSHHLGVKAILVCDIVMLYVFLKLHFHGHKFM